MRVIRYEIGFIPQKFFILPSGLAYTRRRGYK
jgi:hypothetical protein